MLEIDLHTHTFFSACGIHTHLEILERAKKLGMTAVAITDHGPALNPRFTAPFYDRLNSPVDGISLIKGMECNLVDDNGTIDLPEKQLKYLDVVLLGIHPNTPKGLGAPKYTEMLIKAVEQNTTIDILTHLNDLTYPVEFEPVVRAAKRHGIAIELNNSKTLLKRVPDDMTMALVETVKRFEAKLVITSDMHAIEELGLDESVKPFVTKSELPAWQVISNSAEQTLRFVEERKRLKK